MKLQVFVSSNHIEKGKRYSTSACPVALAILDLLHVCGDDATNQQIVVTRLYGSWITGGLFEGKYAQHPKKIVDWITSFDAGTQVHPIIFDLELIDS